MSTPRKPRRPIASCTVAVPIGASASTTSRGGALDRAHHDVPVPGVLGVRSTVASSTHEPREHAPDVAVEHLLLGRRVERRVVEVALRVVVVVAGVGVDAADGADHLRSEQDVVDRHDVDEQVDAPLVVDAGVVEDVVGQPVEVPAVVGRHPLEAAPVVRHRAAAVGDDPPQPGKSRMKPELSACMNAVVSAPR